MNTVQELTKALDEYHSSGFEAGYEKGFKAGKEEAIRNGVVHREWKKYRRVKEGAEYYGFGMRTFRVMAEDGAYVIKGNLDVNGIATFKEFKLRQASTITICK